MDGSRIVIACARFSLRIRAMMRIAQKLRSFSARLVLSIFILILLTTLSAGVPAYWLTRTELEQQAWAHLAGAEQATQSLLQAEQDRLNALMTLLSERPTMRRLLQDGDADDLRSYLDAYQSQSDLDILFLCPVDDAAAGGEVFDPNCQRLMRDGFQVFQSRPALLASRPVSSDSAQGSIAVAIGGRWLNEAFLRQLASDTGVAQSVLLADGAGVASSIEGRFSAASAERRVDHSSSGAGRLVLDAGGHRYYATSVPLHDGDGQSALLLEVALPVDELFATQARALAVLAFSTGAVALLGTLVGIWTVRRLTKPLEQLTRSAEAISEGNLTAPVPALSGPMEVRTLAAALQRSQTSMLSALDDLAHAHDWLENLVQSIVEGVVTFDDTGRITFINEEAASLVSLSVEEALGRHVDTLFPVLGEAEDRVSLQQLPAGAKQRVTLVSDGERNGQQPRRPGQRTVRRLGRGISVPVGGPMGAVTVLEATATRLRAPGEEEMQTAVILRDISQEEQLRQLRSYFLANITHEFRTPLSTLNASMELLTSEEDLSVEEMRELLKPIHLSLITLQTLIDNLLESSSIEAGRFVIRMQPVDLDQVIVDAVHMVQPLIERRKQSLSVAQPAFIPPVTGDPSRLTQALVNLLSNASKYSPVQTAISVTVEQIEDRVRISVADQGAGIPVEERQHLFRRFVRLYADRNEQYGIGLGLHVVQTTIEAHSGQVGVDENPGGGSVFWLELPIASGKDEA
jgi:PAS domain S-box-containing protein